MQFLPSKAAKIYRPCLYLDGDNVGTYSNKPENNLSADIL